MISQALVTSEIVAPALDGICHNTDQQRIIFDPSPEVDSLAERIASLRDNNVPDDVIAHLFADLRALVASNRAERVVHRRVSRTGDDLARALGAAPAPAGGACELTVTGIKRLLGGPDGALAVIANPAGRDGRELTAARSVVRRVVDRAPSAVLRGRSLRNQLGARRHDLLLELAAEWGRGA